MKIFLKYKFLLFFFIVVKLAGKTPSEIQNPLVVEKNKQAPRSTFFNFESKKLAIKPEPGESKYFISLNGDWKFQWVRDPADRPKNFYKLKS